MNKRSGRFELIVHLFFIHEKLCINFKNQINTLSHQKIIELFDTSLLKRSYDCLRTKLTTSIVIWKNEFFQRDIDANTSKDRCRAPSSSPACYCIRGETGVSTSKLLKKSSRYPPLRYSSWTHVMQKCKRQKKR